jgi:hypothetical protein
MGFSTLICFILTLLFVKLNLPFFTVLFILLTAISFLSTLLNHNMINK